MPFLVREVRSIQEAGIDIDVFSFSGGLRPYNYLRAAWQLKRRLRRHRYDLLHAQWGQSGLATLFSTRLPRIVTFRGSDVNGILSSSGRQTVRGRLLRFLSQLVAQRAQEVIAVSLPIARLLPRCDVHVIPTGIDLQLFRPLPRKQARQALGLAPDSKYVLFAGGRSNPIKRYPLARAAVSRLQGVELLVTEGVLPDTMPLYMNAADALLLTSSREGSPNVVKEALACNLPVVSVDVGDVAIRLIGVEGCAVCEDDQVQTISAHLERILQGPPPPNARCSVASLSLPRTAARIVSVYDQALAGIR